MPDQHIPRSSITVRAELNDAMKLRQQLGEDCDPKLLLDTIEGETNLAEACALDLASMANVLPKGTKLQCARISQ